MDTSRRRFCRSLVSAAVASVFSPYVRTVAGFEMVSSLSFVGTTTGRWSSSEPEWQSFPPGKYMAQFKEAPIVRRFESDFASLEFRVLTSLP